MVAEHISAVVVFGSWLYGLTRGAFEDKAKESIRSVFDGSLRPMVENLLDITRDEDAMPKNANLEKAIAEAKTFATQYLFYANILHHEALELKNIAFDFAGFEISSLEAAFGNFITNELLVLEEKNPEFESDFAYGKIHCILAACEDNKENIIAFRQELAKTLKDELFLKLVKRFGTAGLPPELKVMLYEGFSIDGKGYDWMELFVLKFAGILKTPEHARAKIAFQNRLLSDIRMDLQFLSIDVKNQFNVLEQSFDELKLVLGKFEAWLEKLSNQLSVVHEDVLATKEEVLATKEEVMALREDFNAFSDKYEKGHLDAYVFPHFLKEVEFPLMPAHGLATEKVRFCELLDKPGLTLLRGVAGVGKTTFALEYFREACKDYDHIFWISFPSFGDKRNSSAFDYFKEALISDDSFAALSLGLKDFKTYSAIERYDLIIYTLRTMKGKNLFIVDNVAYDGFRELSKMISAPNWKIAFVSRCALDFHKTLILQGLDEVEARAFFISLCPVEAHEEEDLKDLISCLLYHPFLIQIAAITIAKSFGKLQISDLLEDAKNDSLDKLKYNQVVQVSNVETSLNKYLNDTFSFQDLSDLELKVLKSLYFLDVASTISYADLVDLLGVLSKDEVVFQQAINHLSDWGWIEIQRMKFIFLPQMSRFLIAQILKPDIKDALPLINYLRLAKKEYKNE